MNIWVKGLLNSVITGAATAGASWMAINAAGAAGATVPILNVKSLGIILLVGALTNAFSFLRQSPLFQTTVTTTEVTTTKDLK